MATPPPPVSGDDDADAAPLDESLHERFFTGDEMVGDEGPDDAIDKKPIPEVGGEMFSGCCGFEISSRHLRNPGNSSSSMERSTSSCTPSKNVSSISRGTPSRELATRASHFSRSARYLRPSKATWHGAPGTTYSSIIFFARVNDFGPKGSDWNSLRKAVV